MYLQYLIYFQSDEMPCAFSQWRRFHCFSLILTAKFKRYRIVFFENVDFSNKYIDKQLKTRYTTREININTQASSK